MISPTAPPRHPLSRCPQRLLRHGRLPLAAGHRYGDSRYIGYRSRVAAIDLVEDDPEDARARAAEIVAQLDQAAPIEAPGLVHEQTRVGIARPAAASRTPRGGPGESITTSSYSLLQIRRSARTMRPTRADRSGSRAARPRAAGRTPRRSGCTSASSSRALSARISARPGERATLKTRCRRGRRMSASISTTFLPMRANAAARFARGGRLALARRSRS